MKKLIIIASLFLSLQACVDTKHKCGTYAVKEKQQNQIAQNKGTEQPDGTQTIPSGTYHMGQADENVPKAQYTENNIIDVENDIVYETEEIEYPASGSISRSYKKIEMNNYAPKPVPYPQTEPVQTQEHNTEGYVHTPENEYKSVQNEPLSTFSIDVDAASYTNTRRYLNNGSLPPTDAVRIEEFINYFSYNYEKPTGEDPFSITTEYASCPWNTNHQLLHVGLQGKRYEFNELENMNLVFLIDVSGSMSDQNKLPLLKKSFELMTKKLRAEDRVAIVVYAGAAGLVLPSTSGSNATAIMSAINNLNAGGSTAGGQGIELAYKIAKENFIENGINRVILATDGDFNIGSSSDGEMTRLIEEKRNDGIFITALGFGMGNYKDSKMETIADKGNGNYFYIDNLEEARKTLVTELDGTLNTIAKDVKIQIEFNPEKVKAYRLIGYVNRKLNKEDFNDDKKDAGELGAGHTVTALYEIIPANSKETITGSVDELRYQKPSATNVELKNSNEIAMIKLRYKQPNGNTSKLLVHYLSQVNSSTSENFQFSAAVAGFGMLLSESKYSNGMTYNDIVEWANNSKGIDSEGYRSEFIQLVKMADLLADKTVMK